MKPENNTPKTKAAERRFQESPILSRNEEGAESRTVEGYAAVYNSTTDLGYFTEEIAPGAFKDVLLDDVRCLINHDTNLLLARSKNGKGTLTLTEDEKGLKFSFTPGSQSYARDLLESIDRGDINQASFMFSVEEETWSHNETDDTYHRTITKVGRLMDVSVVTFPAYEAAEVNARSAESVVIPDSIKNQQPDSQEFDSRKWAEANLCVIKLKAK